MRGLSDVKLTLPNYRLRRIWFQGDWVRLTPQEMEIVSILMVLRGRAIHPNELLGLIWPNPDDEPDCSISVLRTVICRIRRKLPDLIVMVGYGLGYMILRPGQEWKKALGGVDYKARGQKALATGIARGTRKINRKIPENKP